MSTTRRLILPDGWQEAIDQIAEETGESVNRTILLLMEPQLRHLAGPIQSPPSKPGPKAKTKPRSKKKATKKTAKK